MTSHHHDINSSGYSVFAIECKMLRRARVSVEDKLRIVRAYRALENYQLLADQLGINRSTARSIVSQAMRQPDPEAIENRPRGGARGIKMDEEMRAAVEDILSGNAGITLRDLNAELRRRLPNKPHISEFHLSRVCHGLFFTLKKLEAAPFDRNREDIKEERHRYATWFLEVAHCSPRVIYVDESGFNVWTQRTRGRARVGERAVRSVHSQRGENLTLILAVSPQNGVERHSFHVGGTTAAKFQEFFAALEEAVGHQTPCIFVLDNAPCHRAIQAASANHVVRFLPAYSPMLTPVENAYSAWKWSVKNQLSDPVAQAAFSDLAAACQEGMNLGQWRRHKLLQFGEAAVPVVTAEKVRNWQAHCMSYFPRCFAKEDILM